MVLEVLLTEIRKDVSLKGLNVRGYTFKLRAFADDIVFFAEDPLSNLEQLLTEIENFGKVAGFYVNKNKSKLICKNMTNQQQHELQKKTDCEVVKKTKYLGIQLTSKNIDLFSNNYEKLWSDIEKDLMKWNNLRLSLFGRIAVIKMNVLPRMIFLFQTIPIVKDTKQFDKWQKRLADFIWAGKKPRIKLKVMCDARERGGLNVPNLRLYHEAVCLAWVREWVLLQNLKLLALEGHDNVFGWHAYLWYGKYKERGIFKHHYIRASLLNTWLKYKRYLGEKKPLWIVPKEVLNPRADRKGKDWLKYKEITKVVNNEIHIKTQTEISFYYTWLEYAQIRDLFKSDKKKEGFNFTESTLEKVWFGDPQKLISKIYKILLQWYTADESVKVQMIKWAINVNKEIDMANWEYLWKTSIKTTACTTLRENCYKMIYRWYLTPKKLANDNDTMSNKCWKCKKHEGSFYHMWWSCEIAKEYWSMIYDEMRKVLKCNFLKKPETMLLSLNLQDFNKMDRTLVFYMLIAARVLYAQHWKTQKIPSLEDWKLKILHYMDMDKLTRQLKELEPIDFWSDWRKLIDYFEQDLGLKKYMIGYDIF